MRSKIHTDADYAQYYASRNFRERMRRLQLKAAALNAYGVVCVCCGEDLFEGLNIDHVYGSGSIDKKIYGGGGAVLYRRLRREGYPNGYQVLCGTCNMAKGKSRICPLKL